MSFVNLSAAGHRAAAAPPMKTPNEDGRIATASNPTKQAASSTAAPPESAQPRAEQAQATEQPTSAATRKAQTNAATLQAHLEVSVGSKGNPLALVLKAALEGINEALAPTFGDNAAEKIRDSGVDVSAEATADRILTLSTGFFDRYQEQHQDLSLEEQVDSFISLIAGGVDQGFGEAKNILDGLGVLNGDLADNIDRTYSLIQSGFDDFRDRILGGETVDSGVNSVEVGEASSALYSRSGSAAL
ncbi:MAG: hypothetical protein COA42_16750 [Alteromonadaceae bacterium]|nr:MAG: hypothetical protein COA42_16750 [Alteromonadaceae bacterium]